MINLHVSCPPDFDPKLWPALSERLMRLLVDRHGILPNYEVQCWWQFDDFLNEREIKDIAVFMFGNDLTYTTNMVAHLRLLGDGDCPQCGSSDRTNIDGGHGRNEYGLYIESLGMKCNNCEFEDLK